uniref:Homeobox protein CDX-2 n=2 Tax=Cacopsylla melanoneura TaxID=428564 RepID=A0A8D8QIS7_9HEMI
MEIMHRQFYTPPSNQFHPPPTGWYSNPYHYHHHQQSTPPSFLSCMHESTEQHHQPWTSLQNTHPPHHMFQSDWFPDTPNTFSNDIKEENVLSSTPNTVSGSEVSASPGPPASTSVHEGFAGVNAPRSPYEWMRKTSYQPQPGKTRTKDKYRVVYSDQQRLELEKEFHYSRYITIRRKAELANSLGLSERQVKIWFQNRRAKERKQLKKREDVVIKDPTKDLFLSKVM